MATNSIISGGNIGSFPTASITGFPPGVLTYPAIIDNAGASAAQTDLAAAIIYYQNLTPTLFGLSDLSTGGNGTDAATYTPGNYFGASSLDIPTSITLDAQGDPNAVFVFVAGSTVTLESGASVLLINGAQAANVVFVAGSSFTSIATSTMNGNILAVASVTLGGGVLNGRALANNGAVTISGATAVTVPMPGGSGQPHTLVFDTEHMGWVWDLYDPPATIHGSNQGESIQGNLVGCQDGSVRLLVSNGVEAPAATVATPGIGGQGWMTAYEATFEYKCDSGATVSFFAVDANNGSYAPNPIILDSTGGQITKFTTKVSPSKWKLLQTQFDWSDPSLEVYLEGCSIAVKPWGGEFKNVPLFRPAGGEGGQT